MADWHELGSTRSQPEEPPKEPEPKQPEQPAEQEAATQSKPRLSKKKILLLCIAVLIAIAAIVSIAVVVFTEKHTESPNGMSDEATTPTSETPPEAETSISQLETPEEKFWYCAETMYTIAHSADSLCGVWENDSENGTYMDIKLLRDANPAAANRADDLAREFTEFEEFFETVEQPSEEYADAMKTLRKEYLSCKTLVNLATEAQMWKDSYVKDRAGAMNAVGLNTNDLKDFAAEIGQEFNPVIPTEPEIDTAVREPDSTEPATYDHETVETAIKALLSGQNANVQYNESNNTYYIFMRSEMSAGSYNSDNPALASAREDLERSLDNLCLAIVGISGEHVVISYLSGSLDILYVTYDGADITDSPDILSELQ